MLRRLLPLLVVLALGSTIPAFAAGRITGRVVDYETSAPIADAQVMLLPVPDRNRPPAPMIPTMVRSDAQGAFVFENVAPGRYGIQSMKPGLATVPAPLPDSALTVTADETITAPDVFLRRGGIVTGRVVDTAGEPLAEMMVRIDPASRESARGIAMPAQTNDLGEFRIAGVPPGDGYVVVSPRPTMFGGARSAAAKTADGAGTTGYVMTYYPATSDRSRATPVTVSAGQTVQGLEVTMQRGALYDVSGVVVDETGAPVANISVMLGGMGTPGMGGIIATASDGTFTVTGVQSGDYRLGLVRMNTPTPGVTNVMANPVLDPDGKPFMVPVTIKDSHVSGLRVVLPKQ